MKFLISEERADLVAAAIQDIYAGLAGYDKKEAEQFSLQSSEWNELLASVVDDYDLTTTESEIVRYAFPKVGENVSCWDIFSLPNIQEEEGEELQCADLAQAARMLFEHMLCRDRLECIYAYQLESGNAPLVDGTPMHIYASLCSDIMRSAEYEGLRPLDCTGFTFKVIKNIDGKATWSITWN